jgi:hypothetical protein
LEEEEERLRGHPEDPQESDRHDSQHYERPEMMILSLSVQGAFFFRYFALGALAHSFTICAGDEITISGRPL